ncbi:MAG TPA: serpin family protein [Paludibacteraceae bacterium]|nr:serpin family protein [Paludibacteraceae bacterium]
MKKLFLFLSLVLTFTACNNENEPASQLPPDAKPIALTDGQAKRVGQDNEFAFDLFRKVIDFSKETNVFISPLSVSIALGMTWNGAAGETKSEMESALKMSGMSVEEINEYYRILQTTLPTIDPTTKLTLANSLWYRSGFQVKPDFLNVNVDYFDAYVRELDFSKAWAVDTINQWCAKKTNNLIPSVLDRIPEDAVMYLINAIYFKGIWRHQFEKKNTTQADFTNEAGEKVKVNMMFQKDTFAYAEDEKAQYLDMPYGNKAFSMTIILPKNGNTTADLLEYLTVNQWNSILQSLSMRKVEVYFPRFSSKNKFLLNDPLIDMGMKLAFTDNADFSNIADENLFISRVLHNTYIEVTEEGTEAAAVTVVEIGYTSVPMIPVFQVNKPFLFVIRENSTGVILFMGKMGNVELF